VTAITANFAPCNCKMVAQKIVWFRSQSRWVLQGCVDLPESAAKKATPAPLDGEP